MANFSKLFITDAGKRLLNLKLNAEKELLFTEMVMSERRYDMAALEGLTDLEGIRQRAGIRKTERTENAIRIGSVFLNSDLEEGYFANTLGVYARLGEDAPVLFAVATEQASGAYMPQRSQTLSGIEIKLKITLENADNIIIQMDQSAMATVGDVLELENSIGNHVGNLDNPHQTSKEQVGLGKVDNTSDKEKPVSAAQQAAIDCKVDKLPGKGLSENDYTDQEKDKLQGIEAGANNYTHPATHPATMIEQDADHRFVSDLEKSEWSGAYAQATGYMDQQIADLINGAPSTLDTLGEIAQAMADNADVVQALNQAIGGKADTGHIHDDRYYTETEVDNKLAAKANSSHTHNYAGSDSAGGAAKTAVALATSAGSGTQPVYFSGGKPVACNFSLGKSVPSDAVFTDTNTWRGIQDNLTSASATDSLSANQGRILKNLVDGKAASNHTHSYLPLAGGTINGGIDVAGRIEAKQGITIAPSYSAYVGYYYLLSSNSQSLKIVPQEGDNFAIFHGVKDSMWTLSPYNNSGELHLGTPNARWNQIYSTVSTISTSDRTLKKDITAVSEKYLKLFTLLQPVTYRFIDGASGRIHVGYISQDVEAAMSEVGLSDLDFAGFCKDKMVDDAGKDVLDADGNPVYMYSLRYEEFIALNTAVIQRQQQQINDLQTRLEKLEETIKVLSAK